VVNVARKLGGMVHVSNRAEGGAAVQLELPLAPLRIEKTTEET
jgi:C4-dicarboxylate-specific signal transduction histidine kinase